MDSYGQISPDHVDFDADLHIIAKRLGERQGVQIAHTYRMTRTELVLVPRAAVEGYGVNPPEPEGIPLVLVGVVGKGTEWIHLDGHLHWTSIDEYLGIKNEIDAGSIAEFLNRLGRVLMDATPARANEAVA